MEIIKKYYEEAVKNNEKFLLFRVDLYGLKQINDTFGHKEGDYVIKELTQIFREVFGGDNIIGWLGKTEFIIIVANASIDDKVFYRSKIYYYLNYFNWTSNKEYNIKASIGDDFFNPQKPKKLEELLKSSHEITYKEKQKQKG